MELNSLECEKNEITEIGLAIKSTEKDEHLQKGKQPDYNEKAKKAIAAWKTDIHVEHDQISLQKKKYDDFEYYYDEIKGDSLRFEIPINQIDITKNPPTMILFSSSHKMKKAIRIPENGVECKLECIKNSPWWFPSPLIFCTPSPMLWYVTNYDKFILHIYERKNQK